VIEIQLKAYLDLIFSSSELKSPTVHLIREIYDGEHAHDNFISDLDRALIEKYDYIIIEPAKLADETSRWVMVGNCLHKSAVLSSLASIVSGKKTQRSFSSKN
jgi:Mitochondrial morphogenesis regulator